MEKFNGVRDVLCKVEQEMGRGCSGSLEEIKNGALIGWYGTLVCSGNNVYCLLLDRHNTNNIHNSQESIT